MEYAVSRGLQSFLVSWRNPTAQQADWDIDTYARRIVRAHGGEMSIASEIGVGTRVELVIPVVRT